MKIDRKTWHYRAYASTYLDDNLPDTTTLCQYVPRLLIAPLYWIIMIVCLVIAFIISFFVIIYKASVGQRPMEIISLDDGDFTSYRLPKVAGITIYPLGLIVLIILGYLGYFSYHQNPGLTLTGVGIICVIVVAIVLILWFFDTEAWNLIKTYCKDQKRKVCRRVEFVSDESGENNPD